MLGRVRRSSLTVVPLALASAVVLQIAASGVAVAEPNWVPMGRLYTPAIGYVPPAS